ncbi:uncharacterized protein LOC129763296 [Toxorhynchites rutilus septentrionalis]|uniref:uncharacterized protein LOC129763296 n=1 Tax=Toxorhynchites rutilus septentrionalis TaxID=329112 RepID=UPI00247A2C9D|nr:uncharacterized protein LOC129763296 [Toxorhynchites rutilus septentrionalis]
MPKKGQAPVASGSLLKYFKKSENLPSQSPSGGESVLMEESISEKQSVQEEQSIPVAREISDCGSGPTLTIDTSDDDTDDVEHSEHIAVNKSSNYDEHTEPLSKKRKRVGQKYSREWERQLSWLAPSADCYFGFCRVCKKDVKVSAGIKDLLKHADTQKHQQNERTLKVPMKSIEQLTTSSLNEKVRNAELQMCAWGASRNKSASEVEEFAAIMRHICPDSDIAKGIKLGRTKVTSIITNVVGEGYHEELIAHLKTAKFSLIVDESTDISGKKSLVLITRTYFWEGDSLTIKDCFYNLFEVVKTDSRTLHELVTKSFNEDRIPYTENMLGYGADVVAQCVRANLARFNRY